MNDNQRTFRVLNPPLKNSWALRQVTKFIGLALTCHLGLLIIACQSESMSTANIPTLGPTVIIEDGSPSINARTPAPATDDVKATQTRTPDVPPTAEPRPTTSPSPTPTPPPHYGAWKTLKDEINPLTRSREVSISLEGEGDSKAIRLYVRCRESEMELFVIWLWHTTSGSQIIELSPTKPIKYRIDEDDIEEFDWDLSTHEVGPYLMGTYLPSRRVLATIQRLYDAKEIVLQVAPQNSAPVIGIFNPDGIYWAAKPALEACGIEGASGQESETALSKATPEPTSKPSPTDAWAAETSEPAQTVQPVPIPTKSPTKPPKMDTKCCISMESTKQEILDVMGNPDDVLVYGPTEESWQYGDFTVAVHPSRDIVLGWSYQGRLKQSPIEVLSSVTQLPFSNPDGLIETGSSVEAVIAVMGEPESVMRWGRSDPFLWRFGYAAVYMTQDGQKVDSWDYVGPFKESPFKFLFLIQAVRSSDSTGKLEIGSTAKQVLEVMGEPDAVAYEGDRADSWWQFGNAAVWIHPQGKRVTSWTYVGSLAHSPFRLLSQITVAPNSNPAGKISEGSTMEEVVAILGEPDGVNNGGRGDSIGWDYYHSVVFTDPATGRVVDWHYRGGLDESPFR